MTEGRTEGRARPGTGDRGTPGEVFTDAELARMEARAASLAERMEGATEPDPATPPDAELLERRLDRWRERAGGGDRERFHRRLRWAGLTEEELPSLLGPRRRSPDADPSPWTEIVRRVARRARAEAGAGSSGDEDAPWLLPDLPVPFEELLVPFVREARERIERRAPRYRQLLSGRARRTLERRLLGLLAGPAYRTFQLERSVQALERGEGQTPLGPLGAPESDEGYAAFVEGMLEDGYRRLFLEYPVLARLLATVVVRWVEAGAELVRRLDGDLPAIRATFRDPDAERVDDFRLGLSDPHNEGRRVVGVRFETGLKVMYKPKDLGPEVAFNELLRWFNRTGISLPLKTLRVLSRDGWGWMEYAEATPCEDESELRRFYRRSGMILAVIHVLRGNDFHFENVLACGDQPVPVDLETLLTPALRTPRGRKVSTEAHREARDRLEASVMSTHFMPALIPIPGGESVADISGLGAVRAREAEVPVLDDVNTDRMRLVRRRRLRESGRNSPFDDETTPDLAPYMDDLLAGFEEAIGFLLGAEEYLLTWWKPHWDPERTRFRVVLRSTSVYASLLERTTEPRYLRDGVDRSIELEGLARAWTHEEERPALWPVFGAEVEALEGMDVPFFRFRVDATDLESHSGVIADGVTERPWQTLRDHWARLRAGGVRRQVRIIRTAVHGHGSRRAPAPAGEVPSAPGISPEDFLAEAREIGRALRERAVVGSDGSACWLGLAHRPATHRCGYGLLDQTLYTGSGGILLFLAALDRVVGEGGDDGLVHGAVDHWLSLLERATLSGADVARAGAFDGLGSAVYVLASLGRWLAREDCFRAAVDVARLADEERLAADRTFHVGGGSAGLALALLALHRASGSDEALAVASRCGRHLLDARKPSADGPAWPGLNGGDERLARGPDGVAFALRRLGEATGEDAFSGAAEETFARPRPSRGDDTSSSRQEMPAETTGWCDGAAGSLLARLPGPDAPVPGAPTGTDASTEALVDRVLAPGTDGADTLCCGTLGRAAVLETAGRRLDRPRLCEAARLRAAAVVERARRHGSYRHFHRAHGPIDNPGLFRGASGIGYALLRLARPDAVPSLLSFDVPP